tara:strand:+ start:10793 stop:11551 length:759 start_codon:yes stop_codon:yes gene_type:complete
MKFKSIIIFSLFIIFNNGILFSEENKNTLKSNNPSKEKRFINNEKSNKVKIHIVRQGDTLSSISSKYSISKEMIIKFNNLMDENYIYVGQNLKILNEESSELIKDNTMNRKYHEIKEGENLTEISSKYGITLKNLIQLNKIENPDSIEVGKKLIIKNTSSLDKERIQSEEKISNDILSDKKYGPLLIKSKKQINLRKTLLKVTHENGYDLFLAINCLKREINVRGIGQKWKGWMVAKNKFEHNLIKDTCKNL